MVENKQTLVAMRAGERLAKFLSNELEQVTSLAPEIPDEATVFFGGYNDPELNQYQIKMAMEILISIILGTRENNPLRMVYEYAPGKFTVIDLASEERKQQARKLLVSFHEHSVQTIQTEMSQLVAV
jgi:hypothetical protein